MTGHWTTWLVLVISSYLKTTEACFDSEGKFYCETKWYFWLSVFAGFLILFIIIVCVVNHCSKKNVSDNIATPRVLSAIQRQKNRSVRPFSNTSQWYPDTHSQSANHTSASTQSANQTQMHPVNRAWQQASTTNQTSSHIVTAYPAGQSHSTTVTVNQSFF